MTEQKFFGLGYPNGKVAQYEVTGVGSNGEIATFNVVNAGNYDADYSANNVVMRIYKAAEVPGRSEYGAGATFNLTASQGQTGEWSFISATVKELGTNYEVGDILTPYIPGASLLQIAPTQTLTVDMAEHTAMLDGESVAYYIMPGSEWFQLDALSANNVIFESADETDADSAKIRWRNGYLGI